MPRIVLILQNGRGVETYGLNYNKFHTMRNTLIFLTILAFNFYCVLGELEFYPDFRRPNSALKWENEQSVEEYALEQFTKYLQEQQRRLELQRESEPDFTYAVPARQFDDRPDFAVAPPDPRYYENISDETEELDNNFLEDQTQQQNKEESFHQLRSVQKQKQLELINKDQNQDKSSQIDENINLNTRIEKQQPEDHVQKIRQQDLLTLNSFSNGFHQKGDPQSVDITPVHSSLQDDTAGVYIIAVVAGISAAATVGLIAFAIGWYNLQKSVKNASDVEYPAYGVTGPNKDVSPTGDRRLAQSAQMYHYQHQKQQIIAMESRAAATVRHGSMSEAESDEENEEGDYTVYECPGLAPAGEMEVKNPLFQDDPTPASQAAKDEQSLPDQK